MLWHRTNDRRSPCCPILLRAFYVILFNDDLVEVYILARSPVNTAQEFKIIHVIQVPELVCHFSLLQTLLLWGSFHSRRRLEQLIENASNDPRERAAQFIVTSTRSDPVQESNHQTEILHNL